MTLFLAVFAGSVKVPSEIFKNIWALPQHPTLKNYDYLIHHSFLIYYLNSTIVMVTTILVTLFLASLVGYGLAKYEFRGRNLLYGYFILGLMFPAQVAIVPLFNIVKLFHLYNSLSGVIILYSAGMSIPVFVLTNFLRNVPNSIVEAAKIDGAGHFRTYWQVVVPLIQPAIGALIPLTAVGLWNDIFFPLVFLQSDVKRTVALGVLAYYSGRNGSFDFSRYGIAFAAVTASILPMLILYVVGSRRIVENIAQGAIKQ